MAFNYYLTIQVQACCRALIIDTLPSSKQQIGNAWAGRMIAGGHLVGYFLGFLDLVKIFGGWLGNTQLKSLCMISSLALLVTVGITSVSVTERVQLTRYGEKKKGFFLQVLGVVMTLYQAVLTLPKRIALVFCVQFCSWYGWFLFLFYSSTWVGEVYTKYEMQTENQSDDAVGDIARVGSLSLTVFSTVSLIFSLLLPEILRRIKGNSEDDSSTYPGSALLGLGRMSRNPVYRKFRQGVRYLVAPFQTFLTKITRGESLLGKVDIVLFWLISQILYAITCFLMIYVRSLAQASVIVGLFGFCWAVTTWAPFSLLAEEVLLLGQNSPNAGKSLNPSAQDSLFTRGSRAQDIEMIAYDDEAPSGPSAGTRNPQATPRSSMHYRNTSNETIELHIVQPEFDEQDQLSPKRKKSYAPIHHESMLSGSRFPRSHGAHNRNISLTEDDFYSDGSEIISTTGEHSGVYLGLHNVAITVPQLLSTFISFLVFSMLEPSQLENSSSETEINDLPSPTEGDGGFAIAVTMQLGGVAALLSAYFILKLRREQ